MTVVYAIQSYRTLPGIDIILVAQTLCADKQLAEDALKFIKEILGDRDGLKHRIVETEVY